MYGLLADRIGFGRALRLGLALACLASLAMALLHAAPVLAGAGFLMGAITPGAVPLVIGRLQELLPGDPVTQHAAWGHSTTMFALFQALSGYGFSFLFSHTGGAYLPVYLCAAAAFAIALAADLLVRQR